MSAKDVQIKVSADVANAITGLGKVQARIGQFETTVGKMGTSLDNVFAPLMRGMLKATAVIGGAIAGVTAAALSIGGGFEQSMTQVSAVAQASAEDFELLKNKAREIGATLPVTAQQAADAMYSLASAGLSVQEILSSVQNVTALSISQNYDLAETSNLMVTALRSYNFAASESGRIADVFNNAITSSMLNMTKLGEAFKFVAPISAKVGISFEELVASMGKLSDVGLTGEQIGTSLRQIIGSLAAPDTRGAEVLQRLKIQVVDTQGKMLPLVEIFKQFKAAGLSAADAFAMFDRRAMAAGITLTNTSDTLAAYTQKVSELGRTQKILELMMGTFQNTLKAVKSAVQESLLIAFDSMAVGAKSVTTNIRQMVLDFNEWLKSTDVIGKSVRALAEGLGYGADSFKNFGIQLVKLDVEQVAKKFKDFGEGVSALVTSLGNLAKQVPWKFLADNLGTIATIIVTGWAAGKIALITSSIALLTEELIVLSKFLIANPFIAGLLVTAAATGLVIKGFNDMLNAQEEAFKASESANKMEQTAKDYALALQGDVEALERLEGKYYDMAVARIKANKGLVEEEEGLEVLNKRLARLDKPLSDHEKQIEAVGKAYREGKMSLEEYVQQMNLLAEEIKNIEITAPEDKSTIGKSFGEMLDASQKKIVEFEANAKKAMDLFGISASEAGTILKAQITDEIMDTAKKIETQFGPSVAKAFVKTLGENARKGGDQLVAAISNAITKAKIQMGSFEDTLNKIKTNAPIALGKGYEVEVQSEDFEKAIVRISNGMATFYTSIDKASGKMDSSSLAKVLGLDKIGGEISVFGDKLKSSLNNMVPSGVSSGNAIGKGLYDGITGYVEQAVNAAQAKINSLKVPSLSVGGTGNLAGAINQAGRGL